MVGVAGVRYVLKCRDTQYRTLADRKFLGVEQEHDAIRAERSTLEGGRCNSEASVGSQRSPRVLELHPQVDVAATRRFTLRSIIDSRFDQYGEISPSRAANRLTEMGL
jgi:hypothetical protein